MEARARERLTSGCLRDRQKRGGASRSAAADDQILRACHLRAGLTAGQDTLPDRFLREPTRRGGHAAGAGMRPDREACRRAVAACMA